MEATKQKELRVTPEEFTTYLDNISHKMTRIRIYHIPAEACYEVIRTINKDLFLKNNISNYKMIPVSSASDSYKSFDLIITSIDPSPQLFFILGNKLPQNLYLS